MSKRYSNYEWLRIIAMACIVTSHFSVIGIQDFEHIQGASHILLHSYSSLGNLGVILFIFVSCYFLVDQHLTYRKSIQKAIRLTLTICLYDLVIWLTLSLVRGELIPRTNFGPFGDSYWFMRFYLVFILISPLISDILERIGARNRMYLLLFLSIIFAVFYTTGFYHFPIEVERTLLFFYAYLCMDVLKEQSPAIINSRRKGIYWMLAAIIGIVVLQSFVYSDYNLLGLGDDADASFRLLHPLMLSLAMGIFTIFNYSDLGQNHTVNRIAAATTGIYLVHEHPIARPLIWQFVDQIHYHSLLQSLAISLLYSGIVFGGSLLISLVLDTWIEKVLNKVSRLSSWL